MSSPEARGLPEDLRLQDDPDLDYEIPADPEHWREQEEDLDRVMAEHPFNANDREPVVGETRHLEWDEFIAEERAKAEEREQSTRIYNVAEVDDEERELGT